MGEVNLHWCSCGERWGHGQLADVLEAERHHGMGHKCYVSELGAYLIGKGVVLEDVPQVNDPSRPLDEQKKGGGTVVEFLSHVDVEDMMQIHQGIESMKRGGE